MPLGLVGQSHLSVSIRVHPWLDHIGCGFAALRRIAGFQTRRWHDITRPLVFASVRPRVSYASKNGGAET